MLKVSIAEPAKDKVDKAEESKAKKIMQVPKILSPPTEATLKKVQKASAATPKRRRMANVLDAVLETTKVLSPTLQRKLLKLQKCRPKPKLGKRKLKLCKLKLKPKLGLQCPPRWSLLTLRKKQ
jgi:ribosomal protein L14E/L6E/L27E